MNTWAEIVAVTTFVVPFPMRLSTRIEDDGETVVIEVDMPCTETGKYQTFYHWHTMPPFHLMGERIAVEMIRRHLASVLTHELDESLRINGQQVVDPHFVCGGRCRACTERRTIVSIDRSRRVFVCADLRTGKRMEHLVPEGR